MTYTLGEWKLRKAFAFARRMGNEDLVVPLGALEEVLRELDNAREIVRTLGDALVLQDEAEGSEPEGEDT